MKKSTFTIQSGAINCKVKAVSDITAAIIAINDNPKAALASIISCKKRGEETFLATTSVLKIMKIRKFYK